MRCGNRVAAKHGFAGLQNLGDGDALETFVFSLDTFHEAATLAFYRRAQHPARCIREPYDSCAEIHSPQAWRWRGPALFCVHALLHAVIVAQSAFVPHLACGVIATEIVTYTKGRNTNEAQVHLTRRVVGAGA